MGGEEADWEFVDTPSRKWLSVEMRRLEKQQIALQGTVESMEKYSLDLMTKNNTMQSQVVYYKERETRIEKLIVLLASYIQGIHKRKDLEPGLVEFLSFVGKPQEQGFYHDRNSKMGKDRDCLVTPREAQWSYMKYLAG